VLWSFLLPEKLRFKKTLLPAEYAAAEWGHAPGRIEWLNANIRFTQKVEAGGTRRFRLSVKNISQR
jgi:hypothetical protein